MGTTRLCERCGTLIGPGNPEGLCSECMLRDGLSVSGEAPFEADQGEASQPRPAPIATGMEARTFGDYELLEKIAQGGMGIVYRARQRSMDRIVALKELALGPEAGTEAVKRFQAEVRTVARLQHPNIVTVLDVGCFEGRHFFTMDFVSGPTLSAMAEGKPLPAKQAACYVRTIAEAIHYAHEQGVIHRDLKPSNVLVDQTDQPRVTDFGLAKRLAGDSNLTLTGQVLGTPNYLPPEQAQGRWQVMGRPSDVYGLGAILYFLLTGRPPFVGERLETVLAQVLQQDAVSPRLLNGSVPQDLETLCLKCLEKEPSRRYATAQMLADELGRFIRGEPIRARPIGRLEKTWRWAKRKPAVASLGTGMALIQALGVGGVVWQWQRAEGQRLLQRRYAYASDMKAAQSALEQMNLGMALNLLKRYLPRAGEEDLRGIEWRYLWQMSRSDELRYGLLSIPHREVLRDAVLSPDARYLVTCGVEPDCLVRVWETATARQVASFVSGPGIGPRRELAFSGDAQWLAHRTTDGVEIRRTVDWQVVRTNGSGAGMFSAPFFLSPNGRQLALGGTGGTNGSLVVLDLSDGRRRVLTNAYPSLRNLAVDPTGRLVAYSSGYRFFNQSGPIGLWDLETGATTPLLENEDSVALTFSPDGQWLAVGHCSGDISIWSTADRRWVTRYKAHPWMPFGLAFSPDSRWLATGGSDHVIRFWETGTWKQSPLRPPLKGHVSLIVALSFSADGQKLASASCYDGTAKLWDLAPRSAAAQPRISLPAQAGPVGPLPDGSALVTLDEDRQTVACWRLADGELLRSIRCQPPTGLHSSGVRAFPANGVALGVTTNGTVCSWELQSGKPLAEVQLDRDGFMPAYLSADGRWLLGIRDDGNGLLCDLRAKRTVPGFPFRRFQSYAAAFSPDSRWLGFSTPPPNYAIQLWNLAEQRVVATLRGHDFLVAVIRFSPDSRVLASGGWSPDIWRWSVPDGKSLGAPLRGHNLSVAQLAFAPDGNTLVSSGPDRTIRWWDMTTGQETLLIRDAILASGTEYRFRETYFAGQAEFVAADNWLVWREDQGPIRVTPLASLREVDAIEKSNAGPRPARILPLSSSSDTP
ncbi:MAG: WD40 repeat domain-containing serine/threonine protein kinase [Verrucomicrobiia bacterium]